VTGCCSSVMHGAVQWKSDEGVNTRGRWNAEQISQQSEMSRCAARCIVVKQLGSRRWSARGEARR
jgi:hypothetical protein